VLQRVGGAIYKAALVSWLLDERAIVGAIEAEATCWPLGVPARLYQAGDLLASSSHA
jgi:hypothetical protein